MKISFSLFLATFVMDSAHGRLTFGKEKQTPTDMTMGTEEDVIIGNYLLYGLELKEEVHSTAGPSYKGQVFGRFCEIDMSAQKEDPSKVPFHVNFIREKQCNKKGNHIKLDLHDIVQKTKARDSMVVQGSHKPSKSIPPTAFFYHEGRCGSTLTSNSAAALDPKSTRTYSEPKAAMQALLKCEKSRKNCNMDKAVNLFQDVVYMMGRTNNMEEDRLFFKLLPNSILGMRVIKAAFPDTPWAFVFRDPVHVMVSNMKNQTESGGKSPGPYCTEGMRNQAHSEYMHDVVARSGKAVADLSIVEYCAAYLASLTEAAMEEVALTEGGMAVNYADMPGVLLDSLFPNHIGLPVGEKERARVMEQFGVYSKRMKGKISKEPKDDSLEKEKEASEEIKSAVSLFMQDSYTKLLQVNKIAQSQAVPVVLERALTALVPPEAVDYEFNPALQHAGLRELTSSACFDFRNLSSTFQICCKFGTEKGIANVQTTYTSTCVISYPGCGFGNGAFYSSGFGSANYGSASIEAFTMKAKQNCASACDDVRFLPSAFRICCLDGTTQAILSYETTSTSSNACAISYSSCGVSNGAFYFDNGYGVTTFERTTISEFSMQAQQNCPSPTASPTTSPSSSPTKSPSSSPTISPTSSPTKSPTSSPTKSPTIFPREQFFVFKYLKRVFRQSQKFFRRGWF